jgi:hypothetical protein
VTTHLNWGGPHNRPGLNGSACTRLFYRGHDSVAGPAEISKVDCPECLAIYNTVTNPPPWTFDDHVRRIAHTGEGSYGALDWVAIGVMTCGIGIPIIMVLKPFAKAYLRHYKSSLR